MLYIKMMTTITTAANTGIGASIQGLRSPSSAPPWLPLMDRRADAGWLVQLTTLTTFFVLFFLLLSSFSQAVLEFY